MDWSRTKTILILALILTNGLLFFVLYGDKINSVDAAELEEKHMNEVIELLESEEIFIEAEMPDQSRVLSDISLTYESYEDENMIQLLLGNVYSKVNDRYLSKNAEVKILGSQDLIYKMLNPLGGYVETDPEEAGQIAEVFLSDKGLLNSSAVLWNSRVLEDGAVFIEYRQVEDGYFVENAYMNITVSGKDIIEFRRKWFGAIKILDTSKVIESPSKVLFRLLPEVDSNSRIERPVKIVSMDLGYRLVSDILTINFQEGEPSPYWRFKTDTGEVLYIEAQIE